MRKRLSKRLIFALIDLLHRSSMKATPFPLGSEGKIQTKWICTHKIPFHEHFAVSQISHCWYIHNCYNGLTLQNPHIMQKPEDTRNPFTICIPNYKKRDAWHITMYTVNTIWPLWSSPCYNQVPCNWLLSCWYLVILNSGLCSVLIFYPEISP